MIAVKGKYVVPLYFIFKLLIVTFPTVIVIVAALLSDQIVGKEALDVRMTDLFTITFSLYSVVSISLTSSQEVALFIASWIVVKLQPEGQTVITDALADAEKRRAKTDIVKKIKNP